MINQAIDFYEKRFFNPALGHAELSTEVKNKVRNTRTLVRQFKKVGDLYEFIVRTKNATGIGDGIFEAMETLGLDSLESIEPEFRNIFKYHLTDFTALSDFIVGETYSSYDIAFFSKQSDIRSGIYLVGDEKPYQAIMIKATLGKKGKYPNAWIVKNQELKYYLKSRGHTFKSEYKENEAILNSGETPIFVFIKDGTKCVLNGQYFAKDIIEETDGSMWFHLSRLGNTSARNRIKHSVYIDDLNHKVESSLKSDNRKQRLKKSAPTPKKIEVISTNFIRNPDVIAEVLERANGYCECCKNEAPFLRASNQTPYLEVHHMITLANDGPDTVENCQALCPNCHRRMHYG